MSRPRLSVVVPFYNVETYISRCLESIERQTLRDLEVVLVDDGSPDGSAEIAHEFAGRDPRFRVVTQENQGLGPARNTGIDDATGEYITFVDSDDLVPARAYETMVGSLEHTGSSFAAGNAKRFNTTSGVRPSWTHRLPMASTAQATHILQRPTLVFDRMVWNKVYRRDFWDEHDFRFPAIRYEDWPVTLPAHLKALSVDVLNQATYFWRERESGDSITQLVFNYDNLLDRVISAELVLGAVEGSTRAVQDRLHDYLAEIDLVALMQAFAVTPAEQAPKLVELGQRFMARLRRPSMAKRPRFEHIQQHALAAGDVELLRELAVFRAEGRLTGHVSSVRDPRRPWKRVATYPGLGRRSVDRSLYDIPRSLFRVVTSVRTIRWQGEDLVVRGTAEMQHVPTGESSTLTVMLRGGSTAVPLAVRRFRDRASHGREEFVGFEATITPAQFAQFTDYVWPLWLQAELSVGALRRRSQVGNLQAGSPSWTTGRWADDDVFIQPIRGRTGGLMVAKLRLPNHVTGVRVDQNRFVIEGRMDEFATPASLRLQRRDQKLRGGTALQDVSVPLLAAAPVAGTRTFTASLVVDDSFTTSTSDDPFRLSTSSVVWFDSGSESQWLRWANRLGSATWYGDNRQVTLVPNESSTLTVVTSPPRVSVEHAALTGRGVHAQGTFHPDRRPERITWRRFIPGTDDFVDVPAHLAITSENYWEATVSLPDLEPDRENAPAVGPAATWVLFYHLDSAPEPLSDAGFAEPRASARLPERAGMQAVLTSRQDTIQVEVW